MWMSFSLCEWTKKLPAFNLRTRGKFRSNVLNLNEKPNQERLFEHIVAKETVKRTNGKSKNNYLATREKSMQLLLQ